MRDLPSGRDRVRPGLENPNGQGRGSGMALALTHNERWQSTLRRCSRSVRKCESRGDFENAALMPLYSAVFDNAPTECDRRLEIDDPICEKEYILCPVITEAMRTNSPLYLYASQLRP
jgi:hypothetical protein